MATKEDFQHAVASRSTTTGGWYWVTRLRGW